MTKKKVVSIDIGANGVKFAQLEQTKSEIRLVKAGVEAYPRQSAAEELSSETISDTLKRVLGNVGGRKHTVVLSIPRFSVTARRISNLPANATDEQLKSIIAMHWLLTRNMQRPIKTSLV